MINAFKVRTLTTTFIVPYGLARSKKEAINHVQASSKFKPTITDVWAV